MNVLVTGGTGFVGMHFIPQLLEMGCKVRLLVRDIEKAQRMFGEHCEYLIGDVTDEESIVGCCDDIEVVFHMVAKAGNQLPSKENFAEFRRVNVQGTQNMVEEAERAGVKRFVYISSIAAMGIVKECPISEDSLCEPYLPYQVSKYEAEQVILEAYKERKFPGIIVRPTKIYGVGEREYSYMTLAKLCKKGVFLKVGKGNNYTSNIYITDLADALTALTTRGSFGETYILTSGNSISFEDSGKLIAKLLDKKILVIPIPAWFMIVMATLEERFFVLIGKKPIVTKRNIEATISDRVYDISKAKRDLGYEPKVNMEQGIEKVINWYKEQKLL